jgi:hypothetical protein
MMCDMRDRRGDGTGGDATLRAKVGTPGRRTRTAQLRRKTAAQGPTAGDVAQETIEGKDGGSPVDAGVRRLVEPQVGADLGAVRVHSDAAAQEGTAALGARAFAYGNDVFLGPGERGDDLALMAHELTHVAQQAGEPRRQVPVGAQDHPAEREADAVAAAVASGQPATEARIIEDGGTPLAGQMTRSDLLARLRQVATDTASSTIGPFWSAASCAYIEQWFARNAATPAPQLEAILRRFSGLAHAASAADYLPAVAARLAAGITRWRGGEDLTPELAAAGIAIPDAPPAAAGADGGAAGGAAPAPGAAQAKRAGTGAFEPDSPAAIADELGPGEAIDSAAAARVGEAYGDDLSHVRVHTDATAARMADQRGAHAFAVGEHVAFAAGAYQPNTPAGDALIAHELAHVVQQRGLGPAEVQAKSVDGSSSEGAEVEADEAAAGFVARAYGGVKRALKKIAHTATRPVLNRCSGSKPAVPSDPFLARLHAKLYATPPDLAGFFGDIAGLGGAKAGDAGLRAGIQQFLTDGKLSFGQAFRACCYQVYGPDAGWPLPVKNFADGIDGGKFALAALPGVAVDLRELAVQNASEAADGKGDVRVDYRNAFNTRFDSGRFSAMSIDFDASLDSKGPRTPRARAIFTELYGDPRFRVAYDTDTPGGFRNLCDTMVGPDGSNLIASPRLAELCATLAGATVAAANTADAAYVALRTAVQPKAAALDARDRQEIERSHTWRLAVDAKVSGPTPADTQALRDDLWSVVTTSRPAAAPVAPVPAGPVIAPPAPPVPNAAQTAFLGSIHLTAPASPSNAQLAEHPLRFRVHAGHAGGNPGLAVNRRVVVEPAAQVSNGQIDEQPWPSGASDLDHEATVDPAPTAGPSTVFTAKLTMPPLTTATFPEQTASVTVFDKRIDWFNAHIQPGLMFVDDTDKTWLASGGTGHYTGGQCPIDVQPHLGGNANPGLDIQMDGEIKKAGAVVDAIARQPFGQRASQVSLFQKIYTESSPPPAVPEAWELTVRVYQGAAPAAVKTIVWPFKLAKSRPKSIAADTALMAADNAWLNTPIATAGGLLHHMVGKGGHYARVANGVATGALKVAACFVRSDSKDQVTALSGAAALDTQVAYAMGTVDPLGTGTNTLVAQPGANAWRWGAHPDTVFLNASPHPGSAGHRTLDDLADTLAHEGIHAADRDSGAGVWDSYATEFRAYWISGIGSGLSTAFDPTMSGLGPKSPRARAIFQHLYGNSTYPFVQPNYDANTGGFRERVDNYLFPDGINLTLSGELTALRSEIESYSGVAADYPAKKAAVIAKFGLCPAADQAQIRNNRDWRDLVEAKFTARATVGPPASTERAEIKAALGIPS